MKAENYRGGGKKNEKMKNRKISIFQGERRQEQGKNGFLSGGHFFDDFHEDENLGIDSEMNRYLSKM